VRENRNEDMRSPQEIERSTDIYMQLQYIGIESLKDLLASVAAEIERENERLLRSGKSATA
jgi:hypothetical protein